jgi:hypothetical protein
LGFVGGPPPPPHPDTLTKVQVKTVRAQPWYVKQSSFVGAMGEQVTIYVMIGDEMAKSAVRYFVARNADLAGAFSVPAKWPTNVSCRSGLSSPMRTAGTFSTL